MISENQRHLVVDFARDSARLYDAKFEYSHDKYANIDTFAYMFGGYYRSEIIVDWKTTSDTRFVAKRIMRALEETYDKHLNRKNKFSSDDVVFETRGKAEDALDTLSEIMDLYGLVTVEDLFKAAKLPIPYLANAYGWINIETPDIMRIRTGYIINLPEPLPIS